jgi:hypothetical protein
MAVRDIIQPKLVTVRRGTLNPLVAGSSPARVTFLSLIPSDGSDGSETRPSYHLAVCPRMDYLGSFSGLSWSRVHFRGLLTMYRRMASSSRSSRTMCS